jgi:hypothetical protein
MDNRCWNFHTLCFKISCSISNWQLIANGLEVILWCNVPLIKKSFWPDNGRCRSQSKFDSDFISNCSGFVLFTWREKKYKWQMRLFPRHLRNHKKQLKHML